MSNYLYGLIGAGNMGSALATAISKSPDASLLIANRTESKARILADLISADVGRNTEVAERCRILFLAVKPQVLPNVLKEIAPILAKRQNTENSFLLVSIAAGISVDAIRQILGFSCPIVRLMPNTPVAVGTGVTLCCGNSVVSADDFQQLFSALAPSGKVICLPEAQMDAGTAISGCGPAFVDLFLESLADGGVRAGLPRETAMALAVHMLHGASQLALESGKHPGELKDAVCSPAGSTIEGVAVLEKAAFRSAVSDAVVAAYRRSKELNGKQNI